MAKIHSLLLTSYMTLGVFMYLYLSFFICINGDNHNTTCLTGMLLTLNMLKCEVPRTVCPSQVNPIIVIVSSNIDYVVVVFCVNCILIYRMSPKCIHTITADS